MTYCCPMRARFVVGIVAEDPREPETSDVLDFLEFDAVHPESNKPILRAKFCAFCGKAIPHDAPVRFV